MFQNGEINSEETGDERMLGEAKDALRNHNPARARDLLTRLLKKDQKNPTYWIWLSAAVDTEKERLYCLKTALMLDPENAAAKRGLILFGGLPPDDSVPPFRLNKTRPWEERLSLPKVMHERKRGWANPTVRLIVILGISVFVLGIFIGESILSSNRAAAALQRSPTRRPPVTLTFTQTNTPLFRTSTATFLGPTPLAFFLEKTYTPTSLYVLTQHPILTRASFEAGLRSMAMGNYATARIQFEEVLKSEPEAADVYFYIGESYRRQENYRSARDAYQESINHDPTFAPAFLGRAQANLGLDPEAEILEDLNEAINQDPNFSEAYIARGAYQVKILPSAAKKDLLTALEITPDSALAYLHLAEAQLALGENEAALESATHANELDMTLVPVYLALARAYIATGQTDQAVSVLQTYTVYNPADPGTYVQLGTAYNAAGNHEAAVKILNKAIDADDRDAEAYYQRGTAYLNLDTPNLAENDFRAALIYDPLDFDAQLGLARALYLQDKPGDAYIQAEQNALPLAKSDSTKAQVYYWDAVFLEAIGEATSEAGARNYWTKLINLPANVMPEAWRNEAYQHLKITPTSTSSKTPTRTLTRTPTKPITKTATPTP